MLSYGSPKDYEIALTVGACQAGLHSVRLNKTLGDHLLTIRVVVPQRNHVTAGIERSRDRREFSTSQLSCDGDLDRLGSDDVRAFREKFHRLLVIQVRHRQD